MATRMQRMQKQKLMEQKLQMGSENLEQKIKRQKEIYQEFQKNLEYYAAEYKSEINKNKYFREKFNKLCAEIGIDPTVSRKTMWSSLGFGDFYNSLAMAILDICAKRRQMNGGLMKIPDIIQVYNKRNKGEIDRNDIEKALKSIAILGGCCIFKNEYVCTVPFSLSDDTGELMSVAEECGFTSYQLMKKRKNWTNERFKEKIEFVQKVGLVWKDSKALTEAHYYFPSMMQQFLVNKSIYLQFLTQ